MAANNFFLSEEAISGKDLSEDFFNFNVYANKIKELIQKNSNNPNPLVIGIYGKWGEGKSSFTNLIRDKIEHFERNGKKEYLVYNFNPWLYDSEKELVNDFFEGLKNSFYVKNQKTIGDRIISYSKYFKALKISATTGIPRILNYTVEFSPDEIFKQLGGALGTSPNTIQFLRDQINNAISEANFKVVVFIDDIDRLDKNEIFSVLKLVKLNASFENFIFILNLDKDHVSTAISERYGNSKDDGIFFLEKIINIPIDIPKVERALLQKFFSSKLKQVFENFNFLPSTLFDDYFRTLNNSFQEMNFANPREIIRVLNSFFIGADTLRDEVDLEELFWIELLKVKHSDLYMKLKAIMPLKTYSKNLESLFIGDNSKSFKNQIDSLFESNTEFPLKIVSFFSKSNLISPEVKITKPECFDRYFSYHIGDNVSRVFLRKILSDLSNKEGSIINEVDRLLSIDYGVYKILDIIEILKAKKDESELLYEALFSKKSFLPDGNNNVYGYDVRISIIELVAEILSTAQPDNWKLIKRLIAYLDIYELCYFSRKFKDEQSNTKQKLIKAIANLASQTFFIHKPVFEDPVPPVKMIMKYWKEIDDLGYSAHIKNSITDISRVKQLIRNFPVYWTSGYFGALDKSNYDYMKTLLDVDIVFAKVEQYDPASIEKVRNNMDAYTTIDIDNKSNMTENFEQFIYWHLLNKIDKNETLN